MNSQLNWRHVASLVVIGLISPFIYVAAGHLGLADRLFPPKLITFPDSIIYVTFFFYAFTCRIGIKSAMVGWGICVGISFAGVLALMISPRAWQASGLLYSFPIFFVWRELPVLAVLFSAVAIRSLLRGKASESAGD